MRKVPLKNGEEYDALTKAKRFFHWRSKVRKRIKKQYNKKERQWLKKKED